MNMYTNNINMPRVRREAVQLVRPGRSMRKVGRHFGFTHSAVSKWCARAPGDGRMTIPTRSSRPKVSPRSISSEIINEIIQLRRKHNRCSLIIHQELLNIGINVSISTVKRTLKRQGLIKMRSK